MFDNLVQYFEKVHTGTFLVESGYNLAVLLEDNLFTTLQLCLNKYFMYESACKFYL